MQNNLIYDEVMARLDVSVDVTNWCDRGSE